jgi:hypothetical protein
MGDAAFTTWDVFLREAESARAIGGGLRSHLTLRYVNMRPSEIVWRELALPRAARAHDGSGSPSAGAAREGQMA